MDEKTPDRVKRPPSLNSAVRAARIEEAERSQVVADLRGAEIGRLDLLREAIEPVLTEIPAGAEMFDTGLVPGEHPRLFIDMISFVEMGRDRRTYRFLQDTRHGRVLLAETDGLQAMSDAVTHYIARRLVEREKVLASLTSDGVMVRQYNAEFETPTAPRPEAVVRQPRWVSSVFRGLRFCVDGLGVLALAGLLWLGMRYVQGRLQVW